MFTNNTVSVPFKNQLAGPRSWWNFVVILLVCTSFNLAAVPMVRIHLSGANTLDETVIYYQQGATAGFDSQYDAYKLFGVNPAATISQKCGTLNLQINAIPPVIQSFSVPLNVITPIKGNYTISASDFSVLPVGTKVYLQDLVAGTSVDLLLAQHAFVTSINDPEQRFVINIVYTEIVVAEPTPEPVKQPKGKGPKNAKLTSVGGKKYSVITDEQLSGSLKAELSTVGHKVQSKPVTVTELTQGESLIDLSDFAPGIYHLSVISKGNVVAQSRVLIQE